MTYHNKFLRYPFPASISLPGCSSRSCPETRQRTSCLGALAKARHREAPGQRNKGRTKYTVTPFAVLIAFA